MASRSASTLPGSTSSPSTPSVTWSASAPTRVAITGTPCSCASHTFWLAVAER